MNRIIPGRWQRLRSNYLIICCVVTCLALWTNISCVDEKGTDEKSNLALVDFDKSNTELILRYYFGAYLPDHEPDAFDGGFVRRIGGNYFVDRDKIRQSPLLSRLISDGYLEDGALAWDEFTVFIQETYYQRRNPYPDLDAAYEKLAFHPGDSSWFQVNVRGVMTTALRRVYVKKAALRAALGSYLTNGRRLLYPVGTTFIGEHWVDSSRIETTVMRKRPDGFWDFFIYGSEGHLAGETISPPKKLKAPIQCFGCHTGRKLFEPEKSFPGIAKDGPHGPRALYVDDRFRNKEVVAYFDEHRKRSDMILGIYNTLYVSEMLEKRRKGDLSKEDETLLNNLGF